MAKDVYVITDGSGGMGKAAELGTLKGLVHTAGLSPTMADSKRITAVNLVDTGRTDPRRIPSTCYWRYIDGHGFFYECLMVPREGPFIEVLKQPLAENAVETMEQFTQGDSGAAYSMSKLGVILNVEDQA